MSDNLCNEPGKKSVRINSDDVDNAELLGLSNISASTVFTELLERAVLLKKIQDKKKEEHRKQREKIRDEADFYGLE